MNDHPLPGVPEDATGEPTQANDALGAASTDHAAGSDVAIDQVVPGIELIERIGRGGFGSVYRGLQLSVRREVAVKVDQRSLETDSDRRRFLREITAAGQVSSHPNIVSLYDGGTTAANHPYMVMELCPGGSINDRLKASGPMPVGDVVQIGLAIADALSAAHYVGILHRDVKPANILITHYGTPALSDFGLASLPAEWGVETMSRMALTPSYAPPEAFNEEPATPLWDVYSLGATLYAMLLGRPAHWTESGPPSLADIIKYSQHPLPRLDLPQAPGFSDTLLRATWPDPAHRTASAAQLRDELAWVASQLTAPQAIVAPLPFVPRGAAAALPDQVGTSTDWPTGVGHVGATQQLDGPVVSMPDGSMPPAQPVRKRRRALIAALAVILVLALGGTGWALLSARDDADGGTTADDGRGALDGVDGVDGDGGAGSGDPSPEQSSTPTADPPPLGECWGGLVFISGVRTGGRTLSCDEEHYWETYASGILADDTTGFTEDDYYADPVVIETCTLAALTEYMAPNPVPDDVTLDLIGPTEPGFLHGERGFSCVVSLPGDNIGSVRGS